jgi:ubiquinone/menaquinone biosynthesis C-methylase UbiE
MEGRPSASSRDMQMEAQIIQRENKLRTWFTRGSDPILKAIDGLDIGWGGVQRWATGRMPSVEGLHLDFACGYGTFLAQLGWRFPKANLVGLNIDFIGPHRLARPLLAEAKVKAGLIQADACQMPFPDEFFPSISCFLGLQDIEIGFGEEGVQGALTEAVRILRPGGFLILIDESSLPRFTNFLRDLPVEVIQYAKQSLDVQWRREVAERAIKLYAQGWVTQARPESEGEKDKIFEETYQRMKLDMEQQFTEKGYYVPFGPFYLIVAQKKSREE